MKNTIYVILFIIISYYYNSFANYWNVTLNTLTTRETNCSISIDARFYLWKTTYLYDLLKHKNNSNLTDWFIWFKSSKIWIYNPNNNININWWFQFTSRLLPSNETSVVAVFNLWWTNIVNHPTNRNDLAAQVVYEISVAPKINWTNSGNFWYLTYYWNIWWNKSINLNNFAVNTSAITSEKECFNIYVSWCWDWTIDTWENCDDWNKINWDWCSATCTLESSLPSTSPSCWTANWRSYSYNDTNWWSFTFCSSWTPSPINPVFPSQWWTTSWTCNWTSWSTSTNCSASRWTWPWPWWWTSYICNSLTASVVSWYAPLVSNFNCNSNSNQYTIDIRNITSWANTLIHTFTNTWWSYTFSSSWTYTAQCYVWPSNVTDVNNCKKTINVMTNRTTSSLTTSTWTICWDWILQRPNSSWLFEECDFWSNSWPNWCNKTNCEIIEYTIPSWWNINITPAWDLLLWHNMSVFWNLSSSNVKIENNSISDIFIDKRFCVYKNNKSYDVINWNSICSSNIIWNLNKLWWSKQMYISDSQFIANTSKIPGKIDYWESQIITTLEWLQNIDTFLKSILNIRVAKSTVWTLWWWASLLTWTNFSNINNLSNWWFASLNPVVNKNLILSSLWNDPLSSYVKSTNNTWLINISKNEWNKELNNFNNINSNLWNITITTLPNIKFNSFDNVFIHKWNVELNTQNISWWNKTFIIENWNLVINWNITSSDNILFVVKNWNIIIKNSVNNIDAILISIWWNINWESNQTLNRLLINWALYWNVNDLILKRTYIKNRWEYVDIWTNINFTSKIFNSPPPLLSKFLWEYSKSKKIPK